MFFCFTYMCNNVVSVCRLSSSAVKHMYSVVCIFVQGHMPIM